MTKTTQQHVVYALLALFCGFKLHYLAGSPTSNDCDHQHICHSAQYTDHEAPSRLAVHALMLCLLAFCLHVASHALMSICIAYVGLSAVWLCTHYAVWPSITNNHIVLGS